MALDEHIAEIARLLGGELAQAVEEEQGRREPAFAVPGAPAGVWPHADGTAEDDVLLLGQPVQAEELADAGAIAPTSSAWRMGVGTE